MISFKVSVPLPVAQHQKLCLLIDMKDVAIYMS